MPWKCPKKRAAYVKEWTAANRDRVIAYNKAWRLRHKDQVLAKALEWRRANREMLNARTGKCQRDRRAQANRLLGNRCNNCGISESRLEFDHIANDGRVDRRKGISTGILTTMILRNPQRMRRYIQLLCGPCNIIKRDLHNEADQSVVFAAYVGNSRRPIVFRRSPVLFASDVRTKRIVPVYHLRVLGATGAERAKDDVAF